MRNFGRRVSRHDMAWHGGVQQLQLHPYSYGTRSGGQYQILGMPIWAIYILLVQGTVVRTSKCVGHL